MNKIFKVVWSKTKECYVVVSEVAKNNSGKKKVLASVLAALAVVGAGATGTPVQAAQDLNKKVNISPTGTLAGGYPNTNSVSDNSIVVGYGNTTTDAAGNGHVAYGFGNTATEDTTTAIGGGNKATGGSATAVGSFNTASGRASVAIGNVSIASAEDSIAIGNRANADANNHDADRGSGQFSIAVGRESWAKGTDNISIGHKAETNSTGDSIAMGRESKANQANAIAVGPQADANGWGGIAMGREAAVSANYATAIGYKANASGSNSISVGKENTAKAFDAVAIGHNNTSRTYSAVSLGTDNTSDATYGLTDAQVAALPYDPTSTATLTDPRKTDPRRGITSTIAIGRNNVAGNVETIAIGTNTKATMTDAIAIGSRAEATGDYALAIGGAAGGYKVAAAGYGTAVGVRANAAERASAFGAGSNAGSQKSVAIGYTAKASAQKATSNYEFSGSNGTPSPAGYNTETITVNSGSAPTSGAASGNYYDAGSAVAIGDGATVSDESDRAVVVGAGAKTNGNAHYSVVLGSGSHADASDGFVAGHGSSVESRESIAMGSGANVRGNENIRSQAIGYGATVSGTGAYDATAIGATAQVSGVQGGVALGSGSLLSRTTNSNENAGWNSKRLNGTVIRNRAYTADLTGHNDQWDSGSINTGAVSVGNDTQKRQIINVAAGNKDTDAVNVAQLKNVGVRVGADTNTATITVGTNTSNVAADFLAYNGQLNIKGDNNRVTTVSENDANGKDANVNVKFDYDGLVKAKAGSSVTVNQKTEGGKTVFEIDAAAGGATSTESVVKKAAATNDTNIADISVADNKNTGDVGAKYEVSVSRNAVKDAAREAVTVNNGGTTKADGSYTADTNNPISVTPTKDDTNHNTSYAVTFDGNKAAKQIPLTYKANGNGAKTVTLEKGLDFTNGTNTTAEIDNEGVVKYNLNKDVDLSNTGSLTVGGTTVNNGGITIKAPTTSGTTDVKLTNTGLNNGGNKITNVKAGENDTDAVNVKQLKANRTEVKAGDNVVVTTDVDATDNHTVYTVNAVTPAVYTTPDGDKLTKDKDGKFHKVGETAEYTGDIITSFENPKAAAGQTTKDGGMIVNNVGSAIKNQTGATYLDKLKAAADANSNVKNAAVNVSDLKNTADGLTDKGLKFDANEGGVKTNKLGSTVTVQGSGALTAGKAYADEYNTANIRTKIEQGTDGNTTINVGLAKALKGINSISNGGSSITISDVPAGATTPAVTISGGNLSMGNGTANNKIVNLAPGTADNDAVNVKQLKDTELHITPGTYTPGTDKKVKLTYTDGNGGLVSGKEAVIDLSGLSTGGTSSTEKVKKAANGANDTNIAEVNPKTGDTYGAADATYEVSVSRNAVKDAAREAVTVNNGGTTKADGSYTADTNNPISVTPTKDDNNHNTSYAVTFDGNKAAKQIPLTYKATNGTTTSAAQTVTLDKGLNFTGGDYTTASVGADGKVVFDVNLGTTPTVTDGKPGVPGQDGAAGNDGIATVKTVVDTINNSGWKANAKANGGKLDGTATATVVKPGNTVNYAAGKNLIVNQELEKDASNALTGNQTYTYSLNKDIDLTNAGSLTVGDTTVNNGGITIKAPTPAAGTTATTDVKLTNTGLDNGGNTITNVAEGQNNTDAVNVKQLKANRTEVKAGDNVVVTSAVDATDNHTIYTVNAVTPAVYTTPDGTKLTKDKDGKFHKEGETAEYTGDIITSFENPKAATGQTTKDGGMIVNNIGSAIKNQTPTMPAGQTATYLDKLKAAADAGSNVKNAAVNVSDLHNTAEALKSNELHIRPTVTNRTDETVNKNTAGTPESYKYDAATQSVTLKYNDGTGAGVTGTEAKIDLSDLANQITSGYTFKTNATENGGKVVNDAATPAAETAVANGGVVNYAAGKNLTVKQDIEKDGTGAATGKQTYTYALADEIGIGEKGQPGVAGKDGVDGKIGVNGKDGSSVVINGKDGSIGMTGPQGQNGKDGINGRDGANISMTSAKGEQVLINRDPAHSADTDKAERIVYVPKDASGNPIQDANGKNIVREVATMDDGLKFGGDMGTVGAVKLNKQVDVKGGITDVNKLATGNNIGVTSTPNTTTGNTTLNIQLAKDLTGLNSVELGSNTIKTDGNHLTITSPDTSTGAAPGATTTTKVANLDDEKHIKAGSYAVQNDGSVTMTYVDGNNKDVPNDKAIITGIAKQDLSNINNAGKNVITGLGTIVKAGDNVTVTSTSDSTTGRTTYTVNAVTPAVYTKADGTKVYKIVDPTTGAVTWNTSADGNGTPVNANEVITSFETPANGTTQGATTGGTMIVNNIGSAINGHEAKDSSGAVITSPTYLQRLETAADDNLTKHAAVNVSDLNSAAKELKASELHIAPTEGGTDTHKGGDTSGNTNPGAAAQAYKYNATTKQVELTFNDGNGKAVSGPKAVIDLSNLPTGGDMSSFHVTSSAESTTVGTHVGDTTQEIKDGKSIDFQAGKNMTVTQTNNNGNTVINYALDKNLDVESVHVGKDGKDGKIGIDGKDGVDGLNGTNRVDIHVEKGAKGVDGTDGHDGVNGHNGKDGMTRIVYEDKGGKQEVATLNDGLKFTGNNESTVNNHKLNTLVKVQGEGTKEGTNAAGAKEIQTSDGTKFESAKDNIAVVADGTDTLTVKLNKNLKGLDSVQTKTVVLGNPDAVNGTTNITYNPTDKRIEYVTPDAAGTGTTTNKVANLDDEKHIKAGSYAVQNDGSVTMTYVDGNNKDVPNDKAIITGIAKQDLSNIDNAGKTVITGLGTIVKAGDNVTVTSTSDGTTGQKTYTVNAVTPAIYTDKNGNKVVKRPDGTYTTNLDGSTGNDVAANDVIVSFKDAAGNTTGGNSIINNVGSAIKNQTPTMPAGVTATYLDKLKAAADDTKTQNAAVNVSDLHNTANALKDSELHIAPTVGGKDADKGGVASGNANPGAAAQAYKYNATTKQVELTFNDGNGKAVTGPKAVIDLSELAGSIQNYGFQTNADGNLKDGTTATATAVASGKTVTYAAGKNLTVEQTIAANGNQTYTYALNKDLTNLDKVVVNGKDGQPGKDGVTITGPKGESAPGAKDGQDGKVGIAGKDGKDAVSISGKDGVGHIGLQGPKGTPGTPGADGASLDISTDHGTQTLVKPEANNDNKSERIVYIPKDKDGNPLKDTDGNVIKREVATMDDGLKFAGDDGAVIKKALGTQLDIVGGADSTKLTDNNIGVNNDGHGKLKVQLAKNIDLTKDGSVTTGNTKVNNDGITITNPTDSNKNVSLTGTGLNNGGNKITNVANGTKDSDAVNVSQLKGSITTVQSSDGSISVTDANAGSTDPTKGHAYDIKINNQRVVEKAQTPVVYTDKDGNKLYKIVDPITHNVTFNTKEDGSGTIVQPADVIASMNNGGDSTTTPMKLNNVGSSIVDHDTPGNANPTFLDKLNATARDNKTKNGAVNVTDLKSTADDLIDKGLKFDANSGGVKTNKLGSTVKVQGEGTKVDTEYSGENIKTIISQDNDGNTTIDVKLDKNLKSETITVTGKDGKDGKIGINGKNGTNGVDGTNRVDIQVEKGVDGIDGKNGTDGISRIVYEDKAGKHTVATMEDGLAFKGDNATVVKKKLGEQLDIVGGADSTKLTDNNIGVNADNGKLKVQLAKDVNLTKDGSITIGDTKVNNDGITITKPASGTNPAETVTLTSDGLNNGGNKITNVKAGEAPTDAVNVQQLNDKVTTVESSDNTISVKDTNLDNAGHVIDKTKGHQYDITINSQGVVNKAQTPVVYTKEDGTKVYLVNDKFYDNPEGNGAEVPKAQVIASMNNADGSTTTPMKLNNVGSSIQKPNSTDTFLKQLDDANKNTPNGAVNVSDLKKTSDALIDKGLVFDADNKDPKTNKLGSKVTIAGTGALATSENFADKYDTKNIRTNIKQDAAGNTTVEIGLNKNLKGLESVSVPGKDGVDGRDGVSITGKDGANGVDGKVGIAGKDGKDAVSISGKDGIGHIGLTGPAGKDGKDATADITVKEGKAGVDGKDGVDGITRIVYNDKNGNEHQVATHDDGLKFTGNNESTVNKHHLNSLVKIQGEGVTEAQSTSFQSAAGNINVKANGTDTLEIQLNKDLKGINSIRNSANGPVMNFNAGDIAISGGNLSMGDGTHNNKIVNLAPGTNDTDAVNYKQLKDSRTTVTSQDGSVTITPTQNGDSTNYDLKVNPPLDPRVDQLAEEIGRVGAQGAALSALKPIQYDPLEPTQIMAGYGNYRGNSAIAMGVAHYKNESTLIHGGISWAGGSSHMMANAGVTWKVGNRDSEAAVADRYRKGPISSAYAMQQEMAAMKAQNAGLKGEVSDLKAENEQMKAQIAAMMAKLGL